MMIGKIKRMVFGGIANRIRTITRSEIENALPVISQLIEFNNSPREARQSYYDRSRDPLGNIDYYRALGDRLLSAGVPVESADIDIDDFRGWLRDFSDIEDFYIKTGDVCLEKCLEHYLAYRYLKITSHDVFIDIGAAGSPWAGILNKRGVKAYRLDLSFPNGINGMDIGATASDTTLPDNFASVLSLQCAYECFMGDADIGFIREASRLLTHRGRYGIAPLYLSDIYYVSTSPYCLQSEIIIDAGARKVWRDDEYKAPFSRHYSPESFAQRIYSQIPGDMKAKVIFFNNLDRIMKMYQGQRVYCFFMLVCTKDEKLF